MKYRVLSVAMAGLVILATAASAFAQAITIPSTPTSLRPDVISDFRLLPGIPPVAEGTFSINVTATDPFSGTQAITLSPYIQDMEAFFASNFGWRSSKPVSVLLFPDSQSLLSSLGSLRGTPITSPQESSLILSQPAFLQFVTTGNGVVPDNSWVILVNTDQNAAAQTFDALSNQFFSINNSIISPGSLIPGGNPNTTTVTGDITGAAMTMIEESIARQYANLMINDLAGIAGPQWFREGLADSIAFSIVPGIPQQSGEAEAVANSQVTGFPIPTLSQLDTTFAPLVSTGGQSAAVAQGISFLGARSLLNTIGGQNLPSFLRGLASGTSFASQVQSSAGFSLEQLNANTQSLIPVP